LPKESDEQLALLDTPFHIRGDPRVAPTRCASPRRGGL